MMAEKEETERPGPGTYAVTVEVDASLAFDWHGYAENVSDALETAQAAWVESFVERDGF